MHIPIKDFSLVAAGFSAARNMNALEREALLA
jgi:hypothetical protein